MLRVTSGNVKGFKIEVPRVASVRPPLEMLREAVFNILGQDLEGWRVADLFAGSGIMGIEALSRGAEFVVFIEKNRAAAEAIARNLEKTRMLDNTALVTGNAFSAPHHLAGHGAFDAVFLDPPFEMTRSAPGAHRVLDLIADLFACGELADGALVLLRMPREVPVARPPEGVRVADERCYGHSRLLFFAGGAEPPSAVDEIAEPFAPGDEETAPGEEV